MIKIQTSLSGSPFRSDRVEETGDANRILGYTQDYRTQSAHDDWVDPDSFTQQTEQPAGRKRRAGGRSAVDRIPEEMVTHRDSRWDIPRKRALFTSDRPDSTTSGSDIPESHADGPKKVEYSERLMTGKRQDEGGPERLCSPNMELEMAVIQFQRDFDDCRTEFIWDPSAAKKHTPAVALRPPRRSGSRRHQFHDTSGSQIGNSTVRSLKPHTVVCSNSWDDVMAALQLLSHLDGDALNIALLVPESRRVVPGFLIKSLSDHYNSPRRLAEYKRQFQRVVRCPRDDPSIFAIELETLARRAFIDIDIYIQLQMVRDRIIDGQVECALRRHLDSLGPDTPMTDIVDCCRVWESHRDVETEPQMSADRCPARAVCQVMVDEQIPTVSPETETLEDIIRRLLPTPALPPRQADPIPADQDLLIQRLMGTICPPKPVAQERSAVTELETMLLNWLPVGTVTVEKAASPNPSAVSAEGCFSCGGLTHTTDDC